MEQHAQQSPHMSGNNPNPQLMVYQQVAPPSEERKRFPHHQAFVLGIIQIILGILCMIVQACSYVFRAPSLYVGAGYWCGVFFIIAGSFAIVSSKKKTKAWIIAFMVMSILSALFTCGIIPCSAMSIVLSGFFIGGELRGVFAVDGTLIGLALIEAVASIWSSVLGCIGTCGTPQPMGGTVQYISPGSQPVMIVNQATPGPQGMQQVYQPYPQGPGKQALY